MNEKEKAEEAAKVAEAKRLEEEKKNKDFVKEGDEIDVDKHNQALRKAREAEAKLRETEAKLAEIEAEKAKISGKPPKKETPPENEEEDDFWGDDDNKKIEKNKSVDPDVIKSIVDEKIKPYIESESQRVKVEKKNARSSFYDTHPEYLEDPEKWAELLEELGTSINPSGDYYSDLEKAHRIIGGESVAKIQIEQKQKEIANDAGTGGGSAVKNINKNSKLDAMDQKVMEGTGVDAETIESMKQLEKDGLLTLEY